MPDVSQLLQMFQGGGQGQGGQGGQISGQPGSGLAYPVPLSGLQMGDQGAGMAAGGGQSLSGTQNQGTPAQSADQGMDPLLLQAIMAQLMGSGAGAAQGGSSLLGGAGGGALGQYGVPFGGMGPGQAGTAGPPVGQQGTGTADPFSQIKQILGGVSTLSRLAGNGTASPTTDSGNTSGVSGADIIRSGGAGVGLPSPPQGQDTAGSLGGDTASPLAQSGSQFVPSAEQSAFILQLQNMGLSPGQAYQMAMGAGLPSGGELGMDFGGASGGGTLGQGAMGGLGGSGGGLNLGAAASGLQGLFGLGSGIAQGDAFGAARGGLGLLNTAQSLAFPETTAGSIIANEFAGTAGTEASALGGFAPYLAPIIQSIGTGLNIAQRAGSGMDPGQQATFGAIDLLTQGIPVFGSAIGMGLEKGLGELWRKFPSPEQRNMADFGVAGREIKDIMPALQAAGTPEALTQALWPLFLNQAEGLPYASMPGVPNASYDVGGQQRSLPSQAGLTSLFSGNDPNAVNFNWQQGIRPEDVNTFNSLLNDVTRQQIALMRASQAGDPQASGLLQGYQKTYADQQAAAQQSADAMYHNALYPDTGAMAVQGY